jgi:hypothetical protein
MTRRVCVVPLAILFFILPGQLKRKIRTAGMRDATSVAQLLFALLRENHPPTT